MKLCFPISKNEGLSSQVFNHFGSAPLFLLVDTETQQVQELPNRQQGKGHGSCGQHQALVAEQVDALILSGIGRGALAKLETAGITVFQAQGATVSDNILCLVDKRLKQLKVEGACAGHQHAHGAGHACHN